MRLIKLVYRNVTRRPIRSALTVTGMAIAVAAVVALVGIADGFQRSFRDLYQGHGVDIVVVRARAADRMASELNQTIGDQIAEIEGVATVQPALFDAISMEKEGLYGIVVQGVTPEAAANRDQMMVEGRALRDGDTRVAMLGHMLARNLGKHVGDRVEIYEGEFFEVIGIYDRRNIFENGSMILPLKQLQDLLGQEGQVTMFNVALRQPSGAPTVQKTVEAIEAKGLGLSALSTDEYVATDPKIQAATAMAWSTSAIALLVGGIGMLNTMMVSVFERTSEIGVLRAIGWRRSRIVRMILLESGLLSIAGAAIGTGIALVLTYGLSRAPASSILVGPGIRPQVIAQGFLIAASIGVLGAIVPALRAARLVPTIALRSEG